MPFPLPSDPDFQKEVIRSWILDVGDRLEINDCEGAAYAWQVANSLYLKLPPGSGDVEIENSLVAARVKLSEYHSI